MKAFLNYLLSRTFLRNLLYALGIGLFMAIFTFSCVRIYTNHGKSCAVPDFSDMHIEDARSLVKEKKFRCDVADSLYVATKDPGVVLEQHPKAGSLVKKNRRIFFTLNASGPEKIPMPDLVGITLREGKARLVSSGLVLGRLYYRFDISKNVILEQKLEGEVIEAGDSIAKGTSINLVLGKGLGNDRQMVPDLIGLTEEEAKSKVVNNMFSIGAVVADGTVDEENDTIPPKIFRQRPESDPGVLIPLGSTISIWVTQDSMKLPQPEMPGDGEEMVWPDVENENEKDTTSNNTTI